MLNPPTCRRASRVYVKLTKFWTHQPDVQFQQAKAQFMLKKVKMSRMKYYHILEKLPPANAAFILDIICNLSINDPYAL